MFSFKAIDINLLKFELPDIKKKMRYHKILNGALISEVEAEAEIPKKYDLFMDSLSMKRVHNSQKSTWSFCSRQNCEMTGPKIEKHSLVLWPVTP